MVLATTNPSIHLPQKVVRPIKYHHYGTSNIKATSITARIMGHPMRVKQTSVSWSKRSIENKQDKMR